MKANAKTIRTYTESIRRAAETIAIFDMSQKLKKSQKNKQKPRSNNNGQLEQTT